MNLDKYYTEKYIIFLDIEFQTFSIKNKQEYYIRELGIIIFEKEKIEPVLIDHVNFPLLKYPNMRIIGVDYANVSEETEAKMIELEKKFLITPNLDDIKNKRKLLSLMPNKKLKNKIKEALENNNSLIIDAEKESIEKHSKKAIFNLFYNRLPDNYKKIFKEYTNLYTDDKYVLKRMVNPIDYLKKLNIYLKDGILVHKEKTDLEAIKNDSKLYNVSLNIKNKFDIAIYNSYFDKIKSASLHNSYLYLYDSKIKKDSKILKFHNDNLELINKKMPKFKAHNPLVDAFMTIFVFILMK